MQQQRLHPAQERRGKHQVDETVRPSFTAALPYGEEEDTGKQHINSTLPTSTLWQTRRAETQKDCMTLQRRSQLSVQEESKRTGVHTRTRFCEVARFTLARAEAAEIPVGRGVDERKAVCPCSRMSCRDWLRHEQTSKTLCVVKEARHEKHVIPLT